MNTNKLKAYAPKARIAFMGAVEKRAATLGLYEDRIADMTIEGDSAVIEGRIFTRQQGQQRSQLVRRIEALGTNNGKFVLKDGFNQFINETAFTWFNRLTAIRYMEVNEYLDHGFRVLSKAEGAQFSEGFEILNSAADVADELGLNKDQIIDMVLDGNQEEELYRTILLGQCHQLSEAMPFMFEKLDDATELLLPDNLTKTDSILKSLINDLPESDVEWTNIEIIGWLYQFYISEHKDAVMGKVVKREDIPAATQLFTPNWIVKYLVQNSLGRQWLATYPDSELKEKMEYYITPAAQSDEVIEQLKAITPTSIDPEEIKVLDPACGSGHILVEVYEVLREIYLERGYRLREIPELILTKNIYGLDIDDRAAQMAAFAVLMKAREDDKRIFSRDIKLNIHSIQSTENLDINQLWADLDLDGKKQAGSMDDLFAEPQRELTEPSVENKVYLDLLRYLTAQFIDAKNLGSLIEVDNKHQESLVELKTKLVDKNQSSDPTVKESVKIFLTIVDQAITLSNRYDTIIMNPPYMGVKSGMNFALKDFAKKNYPNSKSDLFSIFMERTFNLLNDSGYNAQINMQSWMFLSSFEKLRKSIIDTTTFLTMVHLGAKAFSQISGEVVQTTAWVLRKNKIKNYYPSFVKLVDGNEESKKNEFHNKKNHFQHKTQDVFKEIPGSPIAYDLDDAYVDMFSDHDSLSSITHSFQGIITGKNDYYLRYWYEVDTSKTKFDVDHKYHFKSHKWIPYSKGGAYRKWYGNSDYLIRWDADGSKLTRARGENSEYYYNEGVSWSDITSGRNSFRYSKSGGLFDASGPTAFITDKNVNIYGLLGLVNSDYIGFISNILNPTIHFQTENFKSLPLINELVSNDDYVSNSKRCVEISKHDWDQFETSWDFKTNPLTTKNSTLIAKSYSNWIVENQKLINEMLNLELANESIFERDLGFENNFNSQNTLSSVSLTINKDYRYSLKVDEKEMNYRFQSETISELISFILGIIMGRYSLDREGLVYAHSGNNGFKELVDEGTYTKFPADDDGIVPLADEEWLFEDDATTRLREFVKTVWGEEHLQQNVDFVAESLCLDAIKAKKGESSMDTIRRYFSTQFYKDHLKTYKKRPIYWLFSSGKAKAFECLVYLHRYNEGTLSRMRTEYVTPLMGKLESRKNILEDSKATASGAELRAIDKELKTIEKKQAELVTFDEELKHLAEMKISLDLDDGVKVNYGKFGNLLADVKAIHGKAPESIK